MNILNPISPTIPLFSMEQNIFVIAYIILDHIYLICLDIYSSLTFGPSAFTELLMFTNMRKMVTSSAILPGTMCTGIKNPMNEMRISIMHGKYVLMIIGARHLLSCS